MASSIVGVVFEGEPYDAHTWSGCSAFFFRALNDLGLLRGAFGARVTPSQAAFLRLANIHPNIEKWKFREGVNVLRRKMRTRDALRKLETVDAASYDTILQIGAFYDLSRRPGKRTITYNDTNLHATVNAFSARAAPGSAVTRAALNYETHLHRNTDFTFTMSKWAADTFIRHVGVAATKVEPIGAGINLEDVPLFENKRFDTQNILFIGGDFTRKGGNTLLEAFQRVRRVLPDATLTLIGPKGLNRLPEGVEHLGYVSKRTAEGRSIIRAAFERAAIFTLPSIWEPFGISILEAQAYGVPCIGTQVGAMPEIIGESNAGLLVPPNDSAALAIALLKLLKDPLACRQMGESGRRRQQEYYTWNGVAERIRARLAL